MYSAVSIGLSFMENLTGFSLKFSSLEPPKPPPKDTENFNKSRKASLHVIFPLQTKLIFSPHTGTPLPWMVHTVSIDPDLPP